MLSITSTKNGLKITKSLDGTSCSLNTNNKTVEVTEEAFIGTLKYLISFIEGFNHNIDLETGKPTLTERKD